MGFKEYDFSFLTDNSMVLLEKCFESISQKKFLLLGQTKPLLHEFLTNFDISDFTQITEDLYDQYIDYLKSKYPENRAYRRVISGFHGFFKYLLYHSKEMNIELDIDYMGRILKPPYLVLAPQFEINIDSNSHRLMKLALEQVKINNSYCYYSSVYQLRKMIAKTGVKSVLDLTDSVIEKYFDEMKSEIKNKHYLKAHQEHIRIFLKEFNRVCIVENIAYFPSLILSFNQIAKMDDQSKLLILRFLNNRDLVKLKKRSSMKSEMFRFFDNIQVNSVFDITEEHISAFILTLNTHQKEDSGYQKRIRSKIRKLGDYLEIESKTLNIDYVNPFKIKYIIPTFIEESEYFIMKYLNMKERIGRQSMLNSRSFIYNFFNIVKRDDILNVSARDVDKYLDLYDKRKDLTLSTKESYLFKIYAIFEYFREEFGRAGKTLLNPVPNPKHFQWTVNSLKKSPKNKAFMTTEELITVLKKTYVLDYTKFVQLTLLTFCGMRIGEVCTIRCANLFIDERYLITGIEENARKTNKKGDNPLKFIFPEEVANLLYEYMQFHEAKYGTDEIWLFPNKTQENHASKNTLQKFLRDLDIDFQIYSHLFRKTIATFRSNHKVPREFREVLSCHAISSTEDKSYAFKPIEWRRNLYDEYFPSDLVPVLRLLQNL